MMPRCPKSTARVGHVPSSSSLEWESDAWRDPKRRDACPINVADFAIMTLHDASSSSHGSDRIGDPKNSPDPSSAGRGNWGQLMMKNLVRPLRTKALLIAQPVSRQRQLMPRPRSGLDPDRMNALPLLTGKNKHCHFTASLHVGSTGDK